MPEFADVDLRFVGVIPEELAVERAGLDVHFEGDRSDQHAAFEHVQLRADGECILDTFAVANLFRELRIACAGGVAHPGEDAARLVDPQRFDQLPAQGCEGRRVHQDHSAFVEPDEPFLGTEAHKAA